MGVAGAGSGSPLLSVQLRHLGGAMARPPANGGATAALDAEFAIYSVGMAADPDGAAATEAHVKKVREALEPWSATSRYLNFVDVPAPAALSFDEDTYARLQQVKGSVRPRWRLQGQPRGRGRGLKGIGAPPAEPAASAEAVGAAAEPAASANRVAS